MLGRIGEGYLLNLLDEIKRLVIAENVIYEQRIDRHKETVTPENQALARSTSDVIGGELLDSLLTALMVALGYRLPASGLYSLADYCDLCGWLGAKEEDGNQRWEGG